MTKLKITALFLVVFSFGMLTACGETFRASETIEDGSFEQIERSEEEITEGVTVPSVDEQAVAPFASEVQANGNENNQALASSIVGVSMLRFDSSNGVDVTSMRFRVSLSFGCESNDQVSTGMSLSADIEALRRGENVTLDGRYGNGAYEFVLTCTDSECSDMVLTVRNFDSERGNAIVHIGMMNYTVGADGSSTTNLIQAHDFGATYEYTSRRVDLPNFDWAGTVADVQNACLEAERMLEMDDRANINGDMFTDNEASDFPFFGGGSGGDADIDDGLFGNGGSNSAPFFDVDRNSPQ